MENRLWPQEGKGRWDGWREQLGNMRVTVCGTDGQRGCAMHRRELGQPGGLGGGSRGSGRVHTYG